MKKALLIGAPLAAAAAAAAVTVLEAAVAPADPDALTRHDRLRRFNRSVTNPLMRQVARLGLPYPAIIAAPGRRTGVMRETPVYAIPADDGFIVPLPYGVGVDWCRNVLAAGGCTLRYRNQPIALTQPRIVEEAAVAGSMDPRRLAVWRRWGIDRYLFLRAALPVT
ncbi:MAG: nitroreductase [Chloroflexota bacterium]